MARLQDPETSMLDNPGGASQATAPGAVRVADRTRRDLRWLALAVLGTTQLMIVLDTTIVNVALGAIQTSLEFSAANLQWVVNAYTLVFGGFLLLGGRLGDRFGRRGMLLAGTGLFAVASLLGGLAQTQELLIAARALQGLGGALMAPAALAMLTVLFAEGRDRDRALGVFAGISAGGAAVGLILGGVLTEYLSWEWVLLVNVPIAVAAMVAIRVLLPESRDANPGRFDVAGAVLGTGGLIALVYALVQAGEVGWTAPRTAGLFALAAVLLGVFVVLQRRRPYSLVPTHVLRGRTVLGADISMLMVGAGMFAVFYFLSIFMSGVLGYSPIQTGLAFLPMTAAILVAASVSSVSLRRVGPRPLLVAGTLVAAVGLGLLSRIDPTSSYVADLLPALLITAFGIGLTFVPLTSAAVAGVPEQDAGIASALFSASQQVGGALGLAVLTAVSTARTDALFGADAPIPPTQEYVDALTSGWSLGFLVAAGFMLVATVVGAALVRKPVDTAVG